MTRNTHFDDKRSASVCHDCVALGVFMLYDIYK
jgi:hypothetical protein